MPYQVQETGNLTRLVTVTLPAEERQERTQQELRRLSKTVKLRGFRKGKVPMAVLKQRYGDGVAVETLEKLTSEYMRRIVDEAERPVLHLGTPQFDAVPASDDADFSFTVDLELQPEIDPVGYLGLALVREKSEVDAAEIDRRLELLREQFATLEPIVLRETIADGDQVTFDFEAIGSDDEPALLPLKGDGIIIRVGEDDESVLKGFNEGLRGLALHGTHTMPVTIGETLSNPELTGREVQVQVTILEVKRRVLPELDDEFAKDTELAETLLELRGKVREQIEHELEHDAMHDLQAQAIEKLLAQNPLELPPKFVEEQVQAALNQRLRALQQLLQQGGNPAQLGIDLESFADAEKVRADVEESLREEMLLREIFTREGLELQEKDLVSTLTHQAMHQGVRPEQLMQAVLKNQESMAQLSQLAAMEKTRAFLVEKAEIQEVEPGTRSSEDGAEAPAEKPAAKKAKGRKKADEKAADETAAQDDAEAQGDAEKPRAKKASTKAKSSAKAKAAEPEKADADKDSDAE